MEIGTVLSAAEFLLKVLQSKEVNGIFSFVGYKSQLENLKNNISRVKAALHDAETMQELNEGERIYIEELKSVAYDAEDLFDMSTTISLQNQLISDGKVMKKVRQFFSHNNQIKVAYSMSKRAENLRKKLEEIKNNHNYQINITPLRTLKREETGSFVSKDEIIGRQEDVDYIVGHLKNEYDAPENVSFLCIVGIGGLGKTALAKLVYNDSRVKSEFPLRIWTCISDHGQESLDLEQILHKILGSKGQERSNLDLLLQQVSNKLCNNNKKYLLVLDDVWTESRDSWLKLGELLSEGPKGSWVVVTTRSYETAKIISNSSIKHELKGLSPEDSWRLFEKKAFGLKRLKNHEEFVEIGLEIVEGCAGVPLALSVSGSLLYGQDMSKWKSLKVQLANSVGSEKKVADILKFSYHQLEPPLKRCFSYCALFPKDFVMIKEILIRFWMAQDYIVVPPKGDQMVEDVAEEYLSILLHRSFFQDVKFDESGKIISFKMHDLLHDMAVNVAGEEICVTGFPSQDLDQRVRHLAYTSGDFTRHSFAETHIRSYYYVGTSDDNPKMGESTLEALLSNWTCLRVLDFHNIGIKSLPKSIGRLLHLRYLDLLNKNSELEVLPNSITKLCKLQTLKVGGCQGLKELPKHFTKLVNLRMLEISECRIEYVTCLGALPHLTTLTLKWLLELKYMIALPTKGKSSTEEILWCPSLRKLMLWGLPKLKGWSYSEIGNGDSRSSSNMTAALLLPQLMSLQISECEQMQCIMLCPRLEELRLGDFNEGLQINDGNDMQIWNKLDESGSSKTSSAPAASSTFDGIPKLRRVFTDNMKWLNKMPMKSFQYLEKLHIDGDNKVKSLREAEEVFRSCSSSLTTLYIYQCNQMTSVMSGGLEHLTALETLFIQFCNNLTLSEEYKMDGVRNAVFFRHTLSHLKLFNLLKLRILPEWMQFLEALATLEIINCRKMEGIPVWMPNLTALTKLQIKGCSKQLLERCQSAGGQDWPLIQHIATTNINK